jgi:hypothetical protein
MRTEKNMIARALVVITVVVALLAYFVKPKPPLAELVTPAQELPHSQMSYPGASTLANRVAKSYGIALVLIQSPYTQKNVMALESIREWARDRFQHEPDFLQPVSLQPINERRHTFIEAYTYNLFTAPRYFLEDLAGQFLQWRISAFHDSKAYISFRSSYFDLFGWDYDAAALLARYQSDKADVSEDVLLWATFWAALVLYGVVALILAKKQERFSKLQRLLSYLWLLLSFCYLGRAWVENKVSVLVSSVICAFLGLYLRFPFAIKRVTDKETNEERLSLFKVPFQASQVALSAWLTYSLFAIQILTWIKTSILEDPDALTLLICGFSGNFLHDPFSAKRFIGRLVGIIWIIVSFWAVRMCRTNAQAEIEAEEQLASL